MLGMAIIRSEKSGSVLIATGILMIITAGFCLFAAFGGLLEFYQDYRRAYFEPHTGDLVSGVLGCVGFALGLTGGILSLKKTDFHLVAVGLALMMAAGISVAFSSDPAAFFIYGLPVLAFSIASAVLVSVNKRRFR